MPWVRVAVLALLAVPLPPAVASASAKTYSYRVKLTFTQARPWTYHQEQTTEPGLTPCTRTDDGHGADTVKVTGTALLKAAERGVAGFGLQGTHTRTGMRTHTVAGPECAPSAVFPSTWSKITETAGTVTVAEANTGCGTARAKTNFPTLTLTGSKLVLHWDTDPTPDFKPCPFFDGSNEASAGNELPGQAYRDVVLKVARSQLRAGRRTVRATGTSKAAATETCANLTQRCAPFVTYAATGSVEATATAVLTRRRAG